MPRTITDRKSTRLNSSHLVISYAVFCLKKKKHTRSVPLTPTFFFFNDTATTEIYTPSLHDALPISHVAVDRGQPLLERLVGLGAHNTAVESRQRAPAREHHSVAGVGRAGVDAEDDHHGGDSAHVGGRLRPVLSPRSSVLSFQFAEVT